MARRIKIADARVALGEAMQTQSILRIERSKLVESAMWGFVVSASKQWVVLQEIMDGVYFDGYSVLRISDITDVREAKDSPYILRALESLGRPEPDFAIAEDADVRSVLKTAAARTSYIGIHEEGYEGEPLSIGRFHEAAESEFALITIDSNGTWDLEPQWFEYKDVTRVGIGGRYIDALARFGDPAPPASLVDSH